MNIINIRDISKWRLCQGCGACAFYSDNKIQMKNIVEKGIRPFNNTSEALLSPEYLKVCPGYEISHTSYQKNPAYIKELAKSWGPVLEVWEGYPNNKDMHYKGSSAGMVTALAAFALEYEKMEGVVHIGPHENIPWENKTYYSTSTEELLSRTGSRYAPASPCDSLDKIERAHGKSVFIGKPCDIEGLRKAEALKPKLKEKVGLAIGIFCAGTPSTQATLDLLEKHHINKNEVAEIRYRGKGWPGHFAVTLKGEKEPALKISYKEAWGFLQACRPYRCHLCPDGTSEFADISCGDPWYRDIKEGEMGSSLVVVRTEKGREFLHKMIDAGYATLKKVGPEILVQSQINLLGKRQAVWGRIFAFKLLGLPAPKYGGFSLFGNWLDAPFKEKLRSVLGTVRRIIVRKYYNPQNLL